MESGYWAHWTHRDQSAALTNNQKLCMFPWLQKSTKTLVPWWRSPEADPLSGADRPESWAHISIQRGWSDRVPEDSDGPQLHCATTHEGGGSRVYRSLVYKAHDIIMFMPGASWTVLGHANVSTRDILGPLVCLYRWKYVKDKGQNFGKLSTLLARDFSWGRIARNSWSAACGRERSKTVPICSRRGNHMTDFAAPSTIAGWSRSQGKWSQ